MNINWRCTKTIGMPTDKTIGYLVSDGKYIEYSELADSGLPKWIGGSVYADYEEVSGTTFEFYPTHWCPITELNLPVR